MWFHELSPFRCAVLRKNFSSAQVVEGDIRDLAPDDIPDEQAHFFAGIGGFGLACEWAGFDWPIWTGGFPCQDVSCAGKRVGLDGKRSGLWFEWLRLIRARRPIRLLIENVPALRTRGYDRIHDALEAEGYAVWPIVVGAEAVGAPHRRSRVWIVAYRDGQRRREQPQRRNDSCQAGSAPRSPEDFAGMGSDGWASTLADGAEPGPQGGREGLPRAGGELAFAGSRRQQEHAVQAGPRTEGERAAGIDWPMPPGPEQHEWEAPRLVESGVGRPTNGLPRRMAGFARRNALRALGDSIVPQVAAAILRAWMKAEAP